MRNNSKSAMLRMPSFLASRSIYCTCGHLLVESESSQNYNKWRLDALSIPHYVIKKGRPHGARHGKTDAQKQHFVAHNARKRCIKKNFDGIHDRFQRDPVFSWFASQKLDGPMRSVLNKEVDLGEPKSFLDMKTWAALRKAMRNKQRYCGQLQNHVWITNFRGENRKTSIPSNCSYFFMVLWHGWSCKEMCGTTSWVGKQDDSTTLRISSPCIDDHHFKEELKSVGELSKVCSQIVLKCLYLARIGRLDIPWSVNKLARSITKWTRACDKRLNRPSPFIHHTSAYKQYCYVGNTAKQCRLGLNIYIKWNIVHFWSQTFVTISWMCKKQTSVSHSSTESKIISLDAGSRLDGLPALDFWDLIVAVLHGNTYQSNQARRDPCTNVVNVNPHKLPTRKKFHGMIDDLDNVDIHHTCEYKQYCHLWNTSKQCRLGLFQDSDFAGDLEDSKSTSGGTLCIFGSHTFVPISWMCKKQASVSRSSTESEIISLDAG